MNRKKVIYISVLLVITVIVSITYFSYAYLTRKDEHKGKINIRTGILEYKIEASEISNNQVVLSAGETKEIEIELTSLNNINSKYELYYEDIEDVEVGYLSEGDLPTGTINAKASKTIKLVIRNNSNTGKSVKLGVKGGFVNNTLVLGSNQNSIEETSISGCIVGTEYVFEYNGTDGTDGSEQTFTALCDGVYKLETWGAQGGTTSSTYYGGYGAYATGLIDLKENNTLYINVGGQGLASISDYDKLTGGYNGGGHATSDVGWTSDTATEWHASGGGATSISFDSGLLSSQTTSSNIVMVAAGGGGFENFYNPNSGSQCSLIGGHGGGISGSRSTYISCNLSNYVTSYTAANQTTPGNATYANSTCKAAFGIGSSTSISSSCSYSGGGGGYYGGVGKHAVTGGGSSYIAYSNLTDKKMVCYNCTTSTVASTKTESNTCVNETPTSNCSKTGNGYAKITLLSKKHNIIKNGVAVDSMTLNKVYNTNSTTKVQNKTGYIQYSSTPSYAISNYVTSSKIDVTDYNTLVFKGYTNEINTSASVLFISKNNNINHYSCSTGNGSYDNYKVCIQDGIAINITVNQKEYVVDISSLSGEYYIGVASSNREMYIYDLYLTDQKSLVPIMTSNTLPSGTAIASTIVEDAFKVFDNDDSTLWSASTKTNEYVGYHFTKPVKVVKVGIKPSNTAGYVRVKNFIVQASNDGNNWTNLYTGIYDDSTNSILKYYEFSNENSYSYYRVFVSDNYASSSNMYVRIDTLQFYGY